MIIPIAIEAATRANSGHAIGIYGFAEIVNHCWEGNTILRSEAANLDADDGYGSYYRFALVASQNIKAGIELTSDYRIAPWFLKQAPPQWRCNATRQDAVELPVLGET